MNRTKERLICVLQHCLNDKQSFEFAVGLTTSADERELRKFHNSIKLQWKLKVILIHLTHCKEVMLTSKHTFPN